ncbi:MAG TPA: hypothetical protein VLM41_09045 [Steroidobacteraceae bacterium]|nr:hypothetical protein [Steroidobacteraceae bacterium]
MTGRSLLAAGLAGTAVEPVSAEPTWRERIREKLRGLGESRRERPELHPEQLRSLEFVYYRAQDPEQRAALAVALPAEDEVAAFVQDRPRMNEEALAMLDDFYGTDERLKALSLRDTDGDGLADYRISDYFGKFSEGDIDVDGDGVRNVFDSHPYDAAKGGRDHDGDGVPDSAFTDRNHNGLPDHVDWAIAGREPELVTLQAGLLRDFNIMLVDRDAGFDLPLARAVDDAIRRLFGHQLAGARGLPTLKTVAVEHTALLTEQLAAEVNDDTSAQALYNSQSLVVYDRGRDVRDPLALLGLLAHEIGHAWHMSLDWDAEHPERENARNDFPAPVFVQTIRPFGWTVDGYFDGELVDELAVRPQFLYSGISEPEFLFRGRTPQDWAEWLNEVYAELGEPEDYLEHDQFVSRRIVGDYSLTSPYEWFCDNLQAYLLVTLEETAVAGLGPEPAASARERITASLRAVWPGYNHRNIAPDVREYFAKTFPITPADRELLAQRYLAPVIAGPGPAED